MSLITYVTRIHFADEVLEHALPLEMERLGTDRPLIVCGPHVAAAGPLDRLFHALPRTARAWLFERPTPNPDEAAVEAALAAYEAEGCDGLIALGGGSAIDLAKAVRLRAAHPPPLGLYAAREGGARRIGPGGPPLVAIPTIAGTGSEANGVAVIRLADGRKRALASPRLVPDAAICDPTLTLGLGAEATAAAGMAALARCVESYLATGWNPPAEGIALDGLGRAARWIERACDAPRCARARREMMAAGLDGALAAQKGLGGAHAAGGALAGLMGDGGRHGALSALMLPHVLAFNAPAVRERFAALARVMDLPPEADLPEAVAGLGRRAGLPAGIRALGVDEAAAAAAAPLAEEDDASGANPRRTTARHYHAMMLAAL